MALSALARISRRSWLLAGLVTPLLRAKAAVSLSVFFDGDNLRVAAPELHFLTGQPLNRLKDGNTVVYLSQLTILGDKQGSSVFRKSPERVAVSYDLWEEKFRVSLGVSGRSSSRLTAPEAEAWCLDNLAISTLGLAPTKPFWLALDLRVMDQRGLSSVVGDPGISITGLIELFGRKPGPGEPHWSLEAGPLRLSDVPRVRTRWTQKL